MSDAPSCQLHHHPQCLHHHLLQTQSSHCPYLHSEAPFVAPPTCGAGLSTSQTTPISISCTTCGQGTHQSGSPSSVPGTYLMPPAPAAYPPVHGHHTHRLHGHPICHITLPAGWGTMRTRDRQTRQVSGRDSVEATPFIICCVMVFEVASQVTTNISKCRMRPHTFRHCYAWWAAHLILDPEPRSTVME